MKNPMMIPFLKGLLLGLSLIISIGMQNVYVIKQGIAKKHRFIIAMTCSLSDSTLIILSIAGIGKYLWQNYYFQSILVILGILFLLFYSFNSFHSFFNPKTLFLIEKNSAQLSIHRCIMTTLAFSFLNPQAILDTFFIIGTTANQYSNLHLVSFTLGTVFASFIWFFSLSYISSFFHNELNKQNTWRVINLLVGILCLFITIDLFTKFFPFPLKQSILDFIFP
jgi:L-lysine exporter family protein LysE/ArgO